MSITPDVKEQLIKDYATKELGMATLRQDGLQKAAMGLTALEEVMAVTAEE